MQRALAGRPGVQRLARAGIAVAMIATALAVAGSSSALGQEAADCEVADLGTLGSEAGSTLEAVGRWTTEDCDSRFRAGSDAHTYRFEVAEAGRVRIGLTSAEADSYLYLLTEDGSRITDNDDNGARLDARIERDLAPGTYLVEATTVAGRDRGAADFTLTVSRVAGCDFVHLGTLEPGRRSDCIRNLVTRDMRLALRVEPSRPRLLVQPGPIRSRAHRPGVRERRPCPFAGVTPTRRHRRRTTTAGSSATPASSSTCRPASTWSRRRHISRATASRCRLTSPSPSASWTRRPASGALG